MGKGDRKTRRGKIWMGTFGVRRKRKRKKAIFIPASQSRPVKPEPVTRTLSPEAPSPKPIAIGSAKDEAPALAVPVIPALQPVKEATGVETPVIEQKIIEKAAAKKTVIESPALKPEQVPSPKFSLPSRSALAKQGTKDEAVDAEIKKEKVSGKRKSAKPLKKAPAKKPAAAKKAVAKTPASKKEKEPQKTVTPEEKKKRGRPRHTTG